MCYNHQQSLPETVAVETLNYATEATLTAFFAGCLLAKRPVFCNEIP